MALWQGLSIRDLNEEKIKHKELAITFPESEALGHSALILKALLTSSPYLNEIALSFPDFVTQILLQPAKITISSLLEPATLPQKSEETAEDLRQRKRKLGFLLALLHFHNDYSVMEIIQYWNDFADMAVKALFDRLMNEAYEKNMIQALTAPEDHGLFILAMGKMGGGELNYSSDIDLIAFYDEDKITHIRPDHPKGFFVKITQQLLSLLQNRGMSGYIFRTDFRLRPDPSSTAIAISTDAAMLYYEQFGQTWERSAFIKARIIAGDENSGARFLKDIKPFIYRKYMDHASIDDIHRMKRRIQEHHQLDQSDLPGYNLKLGRGGIREIEFFVQSQQLISGGRIAKLQGRSTLNMLKILFDLSMISQQNHDDLRAAYLFLRETENCVQMMKDEQTHLFPKKTEDIISLVNLMGMKSESQLKTTLKDHLDKVKAIYDDLFYEDEPEENAETLMPPMHELERLTPALEKWGFKDGAQAANIISSWGMGGIRALESNASRANFDRVLPNLLQNMAKLNDSDTALARFDRFLRNLPRGLQLFALLKNHEDLQKLLIRILTAASGLAEILASRPRLFDAILDPRFFDHHLQKNELETYLDEALTTAQSYEDRLDTLRIFGQDQNFLIGVRFISGVIDAHQVGLDYSLVADVLIQKLALIVEDEFKLKYGVLKDQRWAVIGMGKLGSREMSATSDLDLIVLYECDEDEIASNGKKPLSAQQYFARLTQHLITAITAPTAQGRLYEVDMRLRPSGRNGPVATRLSSFSNYQQNEAWTWEHLALTRARIVFASPRFKTEIEEVIESIFESQTRSPKQIAQDILDMRERIFKEKAAHSIWDIKTMRGGQMDGELLSQGLKLISHLEQNMSQNLDPATKYTNDLPQYLQFYMAIMQIQRLAGFEDEASLNEEASALLVQATNSRDFADVREKLQNTQKQCEHVVSYTLDRLIKG